MKRILSVITVIAVLLGTFMMPASAQTADEAVWLITDSQVFFDDIYKLAEATESGNDIKISQSANALFLDILYFIHNGIDGVIITEPAIHDKGNRYFTAALFASCNINIHNDIVTMLEAQERGEDPESFRTRFCDDCIYAMRMVSSLFGDTRSAGNEDGTKADVGSADDDRTVLWAILAGAVGIILGAGTVYFLMKRKKA